MAKYINAADAAEKVAAATGIRVADLVDVFAEIPAADVVSHEVYEQVCWERDAMGGAVPVVRCKDCRYSAQAKWNRKGFRICPASHMEIVDDDFCSYAERKE